MGENFMYQYFKDKFNLNDEMIQSIVDEFHPEFYAKNEVIVNAGEKFNQLFFIVKGLIRTFHITDSGMEFTRLIAAEGQFVTILNSFQDNMPSEATMVALEDTEILSVSAANFYRRIENDVQCRELYQISLEEYQKFQLERIELLTRYSPIQRIKMFRKIYKELVPRLTNKTIASYLNMTPETYSRNLKKLHD